MKVRTKYLLRNAIIIILWTIFAVWVLNIDFANAHETDKYKHQTESFKRYGGGYMWGGVYRTFVNAEETECRDLIFNHGILHITEPFSCEYVDGGIKDTSQED